MLTKSFFETDPVECARALIGVDLLWGECRGTVVETEAYAALGDEACHTFFRKGAREFVEQHEPGAAYVYLNYGMHWMLNVLVKCDGQAGFVLIRAVEPTDGLDLMRKRRPGIVDTVKLCSGPGKLTQAMGIDRSSHGTDLTGDPRHAFYPRTDAAEPVEVLADVRVGISRAAEFPWRFLLAGSKHVSIPWGKVKPPLARGVQQPRRWAS